MSSRKRGSAADEIYSTHLFGSTSKFASNPSTNREMIIQRMLERTLIDLAANRFEWTNLPDSVDVRFLEMNLMYTGLTVFYFDKDYDKHLAVRGSGLGFVNVVDNPVSFNIIGPGYMPSGDTTDLGMSSMFNKVVSAFDPARHAELDQDKKELKCVPIWANYVRTPDLDIIRIYSQRLAWLDRTLEINTKGARRNKIIKAPQHMELSMKNFAKQLDDGIEYIQVTGAMQDMEMVEALDLGVNPDAYDKLSIYRTRVWNEVMGLLGINGANQDKKERLVAAEVDANDDQILSMRIVNLNARREACRLINMIWPNLNVSVDYKLEVDKVEAQERAAELESQTKEVNDGDVHPSTEEGN